MRMQHETLSQGLVLFLGVKKKSTQGGIGATESQWQSVEWYIIGLVTPLVL